MGVVENEDVQLSISEKNDVTKLIATFTHNGKAVFDNATPQVSGAVNTIWDLFGILDDPAIQAIYNTEWPRFKTEKYPVLVEYLKEYAETIRESYAQDQVRWEKSTDDIDKYLKELPDWLETRVAHIDGLATDS